MLESSLANIVTTSNVASHDASMISSSGISHSPMNIPANPPTAEPMLRTQLRNYASSLAAFASSPSTFEVLHSVSSSPTTPPPPPPPKTLYILDSSFNPPTRAHLRIATSALLSDPHPSAQSPKRMLLLLATQNADKAPKPAAFEHRLLMMQLFAQELHASLSVSRAGSRLADAKGSEAGEAGAADVGIDIGVTTLPYFVDKAEAVSSSAFYSSSSEPMGQVHLTGFDTLIRIMDPKYYPPTYTLKSLQPFLREHRLRVTYRTDDSWGGREAQDEYLKKIGDGSRDKDGAEKEWITEGRVLLCEGRSEGEEIISSTKVREAVKDGDRKLLKRLVTEGVAEWIIGEGLYLDK